ncbi:FecCD family ABC transporter permease [Paenibacillus sp. CAU 1782]
MAIVVLLGLNAVIALLSVALGSRDIPILDGWAAALGFGDGTYSFTIRELRLPRMITGFLAGSSLALAGALLQVVTRNPLASPGVIGLNAGAAAAVVAVLVMAPAFPARMLPLAAFGGALAAALIIYMLAWRSRSSMDGMLLAGVAISAMAGALITYLIAVGQIFRVSQAYIWMAGSLYARTWEHVWILLHWIAVLLPLTLMLSKRLDVLMLDDTSAKGLGSRLEQSRLIFILISVGLAGSAVSMAGTIPFVGLMAPHMATRLVGARSIIRLPVAALLGGALVMLSDLIGRMIAPPFEIPVGLIVALAGAPYMLILLLKRKPGL